MSLIQYIPEKKVLDTAYKLVKKTHHTLHLTMIMKEEIQSPSKKYNSLLKEKIKSGIAIKRIGFGTKTEYVKALKQLFYKRLPNNFIFKYYSNLSRVQRLLISDEKEMLFAVYINKKGKLVFYTKSKEIIGGFLGYFNNIFDSIRK